MQKITLAFLLLTGIVAGCHKKNDPHPDPAAGDFRVAGYLYSEGNWNAAAATLNWSRITDLNLAFINPDASGSLAAAGDPSAIIGKAHQENVRVFLSIGGGGAPAYLEELLHDDKRAALVKSLAAFASDYQFDGIDVDLENELINANYASFVNELSAAMQSKNKLLTAALATWNAGNISDATLQHFDFIHIMCYDKTGSWDPSRPGAHAPYSMAVNDFSYFNQTRHIPAGRLLVGLPFYGYRFADGTAGSMTYGEIVQANPGAEQVDQVNLPGGGAIYYNGIPTIRQKTIFAQNSGAAGVMIWEVRGDATGSQSLLAAIHSAIGD